MTRALTMLNEAGDTTLSWSEDRDAEMEVIIAKKMAEGVTFFIIEPRGARTKLEHAGDAAKHRALAIPDEDLRKFVEIGSGMAVATPKEPMRKSRISRDAKEVSRSTSVGVKQRRGG